MPGEPARDARPTAGDWHARGMAALRREKEALLALLEALAPLPPPTPTQPRAPQQED